MSAGKALCLGLVLVAAPLDAQFPPEIRGRVVERERGGAVGGSRVEAVGNALEVIAGPDGAFVLRGLIPGRQELLARASGYRPARITVEVANGRTEWVVIRLDPIPQQLEAIVVQGTRRSVAAAGTVIEREAIDHSRARDLGELLQRESGVIVIRRGGPGAPSVASVRGGSADQVLVLLDGMPINSPLTGEADLSAIPLASVERVRVLRGGQSARYGGRALAGVIAVETRLPTAPELAVGVAAGAFGERSAAVSVGSRSGGRERGLGGLLAGEWRALDGDFAYAVPAVRGGGVSLRRNADSELFDLRGTGGWHGPSGLVRGHVEAFVMSRGMPGPIVQPSPEGRQDQHRVSAGASTQIEVGTATLTGQVDVQTQRARFWDTAPPSGPSFDERVHVDAVRVELGADAHLGRLVLSGGAEGRALWFSSSMLAEDAPTEQTITGLWSSARASWTVGASWVAEVVPGVRLDGNSLLDDPTLSPQLSAAIGNSRFVFRVSTGSSFSPPSLADQFFLEGVLTRPNPLLRPEHVTGEVEGSLEWREVDLGFARVDGRLSAYRADVDGMIIWFPSFQFVWRPENFDVRRRGIEVSETVHFPFAGAELWGNVSRTLVEYRSRALTGQVVYRPQLEASLGGAVGANGVRAEVAARHVGRRRSVPGTEINSLSPYWLADLRLAATIGVGGWAAELSLGVDNLFDAAAFMLVDYPYPGRSWRVGLRVRPRAAGSSLRIRHDRSPPR